MDSRTQHNKTISLLLALPTKNHSVDRPTPVDNPDTHWASRPDQHEKYIFFDMTDNQLK